MLKRKQEELCIDPRNLNKNCVPSNIPTNGYYFCKYCSRRLEQQFVHELKDITSFGGKNERTNR